MGRKIKENAQNVFNLLFRTEILNRLGNELLEQLCKINNLTICYSVNMILIFVKVYTFALI